MTIRINEVDQNGNTVINNNRNNGLVGFFIFVGVLSFSTIINIIPGIISYISILSLIFIVIVISAIKFKVVGQAIGLSVVCVAKDNNKQLAVIGICFIISFIAMIKYGFGEPVFVSSFRHYKEIINENYDEEKQRNFNKFLYGRDFALTDLELKMLKDYLVKHETNYPALTREEFSGIYKEEDIEDAYVERMANWSRFNLFISKEDFKKYSDNLEKDKVWKTNWEMKEKAKNKNTTRKTWIFVKLTIMFFFMFIIYTPFAFSDEIIGFIDNVIEKIRTMNDEVETQVRPDTATGNNERSGSTVMTGVKWLSDVFSGDLIIKLLQSITKMLR